ncbi:hypothetical protein [Amycolatopsis sp. NPDC059657]|uniref:hypothetical protein n=1 Tax=Amycolatopsis sp. NPDC059657 TaxID=3346899 RepID=UPI00366FB71A
MIEYLNFLGTTVLFDVADDAAETYAPVRAFFRHLMSERPDGEPTFRIAVRGYRPDVDVPASVWEIEQSVIRRSSAAAFSFHAHVVDRPGRRHYVNGATLLDVPRDVRVDNTFEIRITARSKVQMLDFVRDLVIRDQESRGTVVLHASAVRDETTALVIAGPKGAGKTTTMLSMLRNSSWSYFTGDKLFCRPVEGGVDVYPWRDYPYVGVGTILADPALTKLVRATVAPGVDQLLPDKKLLLDPDVFEQWLGTEFTAEPRRLAALLLPEVRPGEPMTTRHLTDPNERWAQLNKIVDRQVDTTFFGWQSYLVPDYAAFYAALSALPAHLGNVPMIRLRGTLDVDPDVVLRAGAAVR